VATRAARRGVCGHASLEAADGDNLVPGPNSDGEGEGSAAQDGVGAIIERLKVWDDAACLSKETAGTCKIFEKFLIIASTDISSFCKNSLGNTMRASKTASAGERPVSSLSCARSPRSA
jgi:hypothetical protein